MTAHRRRTDAPPTDAWCEVWWWGEGVVTARWDGAHWRDRRGCILVEPVTHWREC